MRIAVRFMRSDALPLAKVPAPRPLGSDPKSLLLDRAGAPTRTRLCLWHANLLLNRRGRQGITVSLRRVSGYPGKLEGCVVTPKGATYGIPFRLWSRKPGRWLSRS
jgi:hypothetical protein